MKTTMNLVQNSVDYRDVDVYVTDDSGGEWLFRLALNVTEKKMIEPEGARYAKDKNAAFSDDYAEKVPAPVWGAFAAAHEGARRILLKGKDDRKHVVDITIKGERTYTHAFCTAEEARGFMYGMNFALKSYSFVMNHRRGIDCPECDDAGCCECVCTGCNSRWPEESH